MITIKDVFGTNIYANFDDSKFDLDLQGWGGSRKWFEETIKKKKPEIIVEVGSWKGQSAITMAQALKDNDINGKVICIDTWLGSAEHWDRISNKDNQRFKDLKILNGYPHLFYQFIANVKKMGLQDYIVPIPNASSVAAKILKRLEIYADMIYIDASHDHDQVLMDLKLYWNILSQKGFICGDDYTNSWPGVITAVNEFVNKYKLQLKVDDVYIINR